MNLIETAEHIARKAHHEQFRNDKKTPYIEHPKRVSEMLTSKEEKIVGWLHDVLEDSNISKKYLKTIFNPRIMKALDAITQKNGESYPHYHRRVLKNKLAQKVKLADMCDNLKDSPSHKSTRKYAHLIAAITLNVPIPKSYENIT